MRLLKAAIAMPTAFLATLGFSEDTPNIVYRVSPLAPDIVFKVGFSARGNDRDLLHYVSGTSIDQANEGYVSTSSSLTNIIDISLACAQEKPGTRLYIYYIRPTDNFYSVRDSIRFALNVLPNPEVRQQIDTIWHATQGEMYYFWSARAHISGNQIMSVRGFHSIGGRPYLGNLRPNPDYLYSYPEVSAYPMPIHNATVEAAFVAPAPHGVGFEPAGMVDMLLGPHFQRSSSSKSSQCFLLQRMSLPELRRKSVAKLIASGILINSLPRQLLSVLGHDEL